MTTRTKSIVLSAAVGLLILQGSAPAQYHMPQGLAVGSWFGVAVPDNPATSPFAQVYMEPTFFADGNIIASDAQELNAPHSTAHGQWVSTGNYFMNDGQQVVRASFLWINFLTPEPAAKPPNNGYAGTFRIVLQGKVNPADPNHMSGTLHAYLYSPAQDPLNPTTVPALDAGQFTIKALTRITASSLN